MNGDMKRFAALLITVNACGGGSFDTGPKVETTATTSPDGGTTAPKVQPYALVTRTFFNLRTIDLTSCKATWTSTSAQTRCKLLLDQPNGRPALAQLSPANLNASVIVSSGVTQISARVRISGGAQRYDDALAETVLAIDVSFERAGKYLYENIPQELLTSAAMETIVRNAFAETDKQSSLSTRMLILRDYPHSLAHDIDMGDIYVARQVTKIDLARCEAAFREGYNPFVRSGGDDHAEPSHCTVEVEPPRAEIPRQENWGEKLRALEASTPRITNTRLEQQRTKRGTIPVVQAIADASSYSLFLYQDDVATQTRTEGIMSWQEARGFLTDAIALTNSELTAAVLVTTPELGTLQPRESLVGRLVYRDGAVDLE